MPIFKIIDFPGVDGQNVETVIAFHDFSAAVRSSVRGVLETRAGWLLFKPFVSFLIDSFFQALWSSWVDLDLSSHVGLFVQESSQNVRLRTQRDLQEALRDRPKRQTPLCREMPGDPVPLRNVVPRERQRRLRACPPTRTRLQRGSSDDHEGLGHQQNHGAARRTTKGHPQGAPGHPPHHMWGSRQPSAVDERARRRKTTSCARHHVVWAVSSFLTTLASTNEGTTTSLLTRDGVFEGAFVCPGICVDAFRHSTKVIGLDGCHVKTK